jgi:RimJ/RimL family protein N-acetyltransferase
MVQVKEALHEDLPSFVAMEQATDTMEFIIPYRLEDHAQKFADPALVYLRILDDGVLVGFFILAMDADGRSVEFRRVVVSTKGKGIGQQAIKLMEDYCRTALGRSRMWLDVFAHNARGRHIYEKLGYRHFAESTHRGKTLLLYEKPLQEIDDELQH